MIRDCLTTKKIFQAAKETNTYTAKTFQIRAAANPENHNHPVQIFV